MKNSRAATATPTNLHDAILRDGYAFVQAAAVRALLAQSGALSDWQDFANSWDDLMPDNYMADHGRYRLRRHAVYAAARGGDIERQPHQPHYQSLDYNVLHGGIERWFEPIASEIGDGTSLQTILEFCRGLFEKIVDSHPLPLSPRGRGQRERGSDSKTRAWHIEAHQFRIEARAGEHGHPTPEGMHRDGVDYVLVLLIKRRNVESGTTMIRTVDGHVSSFTLTDPFDAALVDDTRVHHGVTPVTPLDASAPAYRDVLVVTFRKA